MSARSCSMLGPTGCAGHRRTRRSGGRWLTPASREIAKRAMTRVGHLLERGREHGTMQDAPIGLVVALATALADATTDFMIRDRDRADEHSRTAFDVLWRMIA